MTVYLHTVPVRPSPSASTFMGTMRRHFLRSISVSAVKTSVIGFDVYDRGFIRSFKGHVQEGALYRKSLLEDLGSVLKKNHFS